MAEVVRLGNYTAVPGEPIPELVAKLESLLEQAKTGELRGMVYALVTQPEGAPLPVIATGWWGPHQRDAMAHGIMLLQAGWLEAMSRL